MEGRWINTIVIHNYTSTVSPLKETTEYFNNILYLQGGADKSLARPTSLCHRRESILSLERGVCSCDVRDFNNIKMRAVVKFPSPLQGKALKEIHTILTETLGEHVPSYATVKNWVTQFKHVDFSICDAPHPRRPKTVTTLEIDKIHKLILEDCQIWLNQ